MSNLLGFDEEFAPVIVKVAVPVRWPEHSLVNGVNDDSQNPAMPLMSKGDDDMPWSLNMEIDAVSGKVKDWKDGVVAVLNIKAVDMGIYSLINAKGREVIRLENDYVPSLFQIDDEGYGDYIFITIQADGTIENWRPKSIMGIVQACSRQHVYAV